MQRQGGGLEHTHLGRAEGMADTTGRVTVSGGPTWQSMEAAWLWGVGLNATLEISVTLCGVTPLY